MHIETRNQINEEILEEGIQEFLAMPQEERERALIRSILELQRGQGELMALYFSHTSKTEAMDSKLQQVWNSFKKSNFHV